MTKTKFRDNPKKWLAILLSIGMIIGMLPTMSWTANAAPQQFNVTNWTEFKNAVGTINSSGGTGTINIANDFATDASACWFTQGTVIVEGNGHTINMSSRKDTNGVLANNGGHFNVQGANVTFHEVKFYGGMTTDIAAVAASQGLAGLDAAHGAEIDGGHSSFSVWECQNGTLTFDATEVYGFCCTYDNRNMLISIGNTVRNGTVSQTVNIQNGAKFYNNWGSDGTIAEVWHPGATLNVYDIDMYHNFTREEGAFDCYDGQGGRMNFYGGKIHDNYSMMYEGTRAATINIWKNYDYADHASWYPDGIRQRISGSGAGQTGIDVYNNVVLRNTANGYTTSTATGSAAPMQTNMGLLWNWSTNKAQIEQYAFHAAIANMTPNDNLWIGPNSCPRYTTGWEGMNSQVASFGATGVPVAYFSDTNPNDGMADGVTPDMAAAPNASIYGNTRLGFYEGPIYNGGGSKATTIDGEPETFTNMLYLTDRTADITYELYTTSGTEITSMSGINYAYTKRIGLPSDYTVAITGPTDTSGKYQLVQYAWDDEPRANVDANGATSKKTLTNQGTYTVKFYYKDTTVPGGDEVPTLNVDVDGDGIPDINIDTDNDGKPDVNLQPNYIPTVADGVRNDADDGWYYPTAAGGTVQPNPVKNIDTNGDGTWEPSKDDADDGIISPDKAIDVDGDGDIDIPTLNRDAYPIGTPEPGSNVDPYWVPNIDSDDGTYDTGDPRLNRDTDEDGKPDKNVDVDGDGKPDVNIDTDNDGKPDTNLDNKVKDNLGTPVTDPDTGIKTYPNYPTDGTGPQLNVDTKPGTDKWAPSKQLGDDHIVSPDKNIDTDGDGQPEKAKVDETKYVPVDENGDGINDNWKPEKDMENGSGYPGMETGDPTNNLDTDGDKIPDTNVDVDGDGIPDVNVDTDGDKIPDTNLDPNLLDPAKAAAQFNDANGDNKLAPEEYIGTPTLNLDTDGTGTDWKSGDKDDPDGIWMPDTDVDTVGDGTPDTFTDTPYEREPVDANGDGRDDYWNPETPFTTAPLKDKAETGNPKTSDNDIDGDGKDDINIDVDGDGIPDLNIDTDGDKKPDVNVYTNGTGMFKGTKDYPALSGDLRKIKPDTNVDTNGTHQIDTLDDGGTNNTSWLSKYPQNDKILLPDTAVDTDGIAATPGKALELDPVAGPAFGEHAGWTVDTNWKPNIDATMTIADNSPKTGYDTCDPSINHDDDGDGSPDSNIDVDGDGIPDVNIDTDKDGKPDTNLDNKVKDNLGTPGPVSPETGKPTYPNYPTDGTGPQLNVDTKPGTNDWAPSGELGDDHIISPDKNIDTDGDGQPEKAKVDETKYVPVDKNADGINDNWKPTTDMEDGSGYPGMETGDPTLNLDTNDDGKPDKNVDVDGDGKPDVNIDTDGDGKPDTNLDNKVEDNLGTPVTDPDTGTKTYPNYPTDGTGPQLNVDTKPGTDKWAPSGQLGDDHIISPDKNIDTDGDGKPEKAKVDEAEYVPVDANGDGINDKWKPATDMANGSGYPGMETGDPTLNDDTDGDGKPDKNVDVDGDGKPDVNIDTDNDGKPDTNLDNKVKDNLGNPVTDPNTGITTYPDYPVDGTGPQLNVDTNDAGKWVPSKQLGNDHIVSPDTNVDTDGDGKPEKDIDETKYAPVDKNDDGINDNWKPATDMAGDSGYPGMETGDPTNNIDTDGDGKPDKNVDVDGDGKPDVNIDTDNDGKPDTNLDNKVKDNLGDPETDPNTGITTYPDYPKDGTGPQLNVDTGDDGNWAPSGELGDDHIVSPDKNLDTTGNGQPDKDIDESTYVPVDTNGDGINDKWNPDTPMGSTSGYSGMETGDPSESGRTVTVNVVDLKGTPITGTGMPTAKIGDKVSEDGTVTLAADVGDELTLTATPAGDYKVVGWFVKNNKGKLVALDDVKYPANTTIAKGEQPYEIVYPVTTQAEIYAVFTETSAKDIAGWFDPTDDAEHNGVGNQLTGPYESNGGTQPDGTVEKVSTKWDPAEEKWVVTPTTDLKDVEIPDDTNDTMPPVEIDLSGHDINGSDGTTASPDGKPALDIGENQDVIVAGPGNVTGGDGLDGENPGKGGPGVVTEDGSSLGVEDGAVISGGQGGDSTKPGTDAGAGGAGAELGPNSDVNVDNGEIKGGNGGDSADASDTTPAGAGGEGGAGIDAGTNPDSTVNVKPDGNVTGGNGGNGGDAAATGEDDSQDAGAGGAGGEGVTGNDTDVNNEGAITGGDGGKGGDNTAEDGNTGDSGAGGEGGGGVNVPEGTVNNGVAPDNEGTITGGNGGQGGDNTNTGEGDSGNAGAGGAGGDGVEDAAEVENNVPDGINGGNAGDGGNSTDEGAGDAGNGGAGGEGGTGINPTVPDDSITGDGTDNGGNGGNGGDSTDNGDGDAGDGGAGGNGGEGQTGNGGDAGNGGDSVNNDSGETGNGGEGGTGGEGETPADKGDDGEDGDEINNRGDISIDPQDPDITIPDDPYDPESDGMIIIRGTWANEKTYNNLKAADVNGNPVSGVTWAVVDDHAAAYDFDDPCVSVDANTGAVTALKSGIAKVGCYIGTELQSYVVFVVPGDSNRDGRVKLNDSTRCGDAYLGEFEFTENYDKELNDMNKDGRIRLVDATIIGDLYLGDREI